MDLEELDDATFEKLYLEICEHGYSALGRSPADLPAAMRPWHFGTARLPSYPAQGRHRFLKTLQAARGLGGGDLFEVAAGNGFSAVCLADKFARVVLNDMRFDQELKSWPEARRFEIVMGNLFDVDPREVGRFDVVMACEIIEHVAYGETFLRHLYGFLRPGGRLLRTTPNGDYFRSKLPTYSQIRSFSELEARQFQPDGDGHLYLYTRSELEACLTAAGLSDVRVDFSTTPWVSGDSGFRFLPRSRALNRLYHRLDARTLAWSGRFRERLCTQLIVTALRPGGT